MNTETTIPVHTNAPHTATATATAQRPGEAAPTVIRVDGLTRTYGGNRKKKSFTAVNEVSFEVRKGEVYGLLGTNGAGKTSTLEILEGLAPATAGSVSVLDKDPLKDRALVRPHTGTMLQSGGLPSQLTVAETLTMWAGTCSAPLPISTVLDAVGLSHRSDVKVGSLSGGEQRRVDLACALLGDPSIIFLDEPTTGLDPESRRNVWELLSELKSRGVTMILTTHYLEEAERLCDQIAIMHEGQIAIEGSLGELVATASAEISFVTPHATAQGAELPEMPGTQVTHSRGRTLISTDLLQQHTYEVLRWADASGLTLEDFAARPASLETVFLKIAGRSPA